MIPYIENVAQPGMKIVFLVRYPVDGFIWAKEEFDTKVILEAKKLVRYYSWEENVKRAKSRVSYTSEILRAKGIEAAVDVYVGSLKKALRSHTLNGDVHLILARPGIGDWIARLLEGTNSIFKWLKRPSFSPVMLIHPRALV